MQDRRTGVLLVISGPSGVGKGTLIRGLLQRRPEVRLSVSCTTRPPRPGETEGVEYYFVSPEEFARHRQADTLLEWAEVYPGTCYGTPRAPVEAALARGEDLILEIDDQGAHLVRAALGAQAVLVFVAPPSLEELHRRLAGRQTESPEELRERLATARREISHLGDYDYLVVNDEVEPATDLLEALLLAERARVGRRAATELSEQLLAERAPEEVSASE